MKNQFRKTWRCALLLTCISFLASSIGINAQTITSNSTGSQGGFTYEFWKDSGGSGSMTLGSGGAFSCSWSNINNILFRKGLRPGSTNQVITYSANYNPSGNSYLTLYGWTTNPLVEYYVVESWGSWRPPGGTSVGTVNTDGGTYDLYRTQRVNQPSIQGTQTFYQYWSVRTSKRTSGTITFANHISAWANRGWNMGSLYEVSFCVEGYQSSGNANVTSMSMTTGSGGSTPPPSTPPPSGNYYRIANRGTGLYLDGQGRTSNGSDVGQWANTNHQNAQWTIESSGGYVRIRNRATGLYLDGMGRTSNGAATGQWANTNHNNAQWQQISVGSGYYQFRNRGTGMYLDGMGRTSNGSAVGQWANTNHNNSHWSLSSTSSAEIGDLVSNLVAEKVSIYPNPVTNGRLYIELNGLDGSSSIRLLDLSGKLIQEQMVRGEYAVEMNIDVKSGLYILQVINKDETITRKISVN